MTMYNFLQNFSKIWKNLGVPQGFQTLKQIGLIVDIRILFSNIFLGTYIVSINYIVTVSSMD